MQNDRYIYIAIVCIAFVLGIYAFQFHSFKVSEDVNHWNQFGGYVGGVLGPLLSFLSLVMLIKSLNLQNESNKVLRDESNLNIKSEKIRSFETQFFNLLNAQRETFEYFKLTLNGQSYQGVSAVRELENCIEILRSQHGTDQDIADFIKNADEDEKLYNTQRVFYVITKTISQKLSDENGFKTEERKAQIETLVSFTELSLLRVVLISMQFLNYKSSKLLRENQELLSVFEELKLDIDKY